MVFLPALAFAHDLVPGSNERTRDPSGGQPAVLLGVSGFPAILSVLMNMAFGLAIERAGIPEAQGKPVRKKLVFAVSILANLAF